MSGINRGFGNLGPYSRKLDGTGPGQETSSQRPAASGGQNVNTESCLSTVAFKAKEENPNPCVIGYLTIKELIFNFFKFLLTSNPHLIIFRRIFLRIV
jgi:hypothetical protein